MFSNMLFVVSVNEGDAKPIHNNSPIIPKANNLLFTGFSPFFNLNNNIDFNMKIFMKKSFCAINALFIA